MLAPTRCYTPRNPPPRTMPARVLGAADPVLPYVALLCAVVLPGVLAAVGAM